MTEAVIVIDFETTGLSPAQGARATEVALAPNYKLQTLIDYADIQFSGRFHRALADSVATAHLWLQMHSDLCAKYRIPTLKHQQLKTLCATSAAQVANKIESWKKKAN